MPKKTDHSEHRHLHIFVEHLYHTLPLGPYNILIQCIIAPFCYALHV